MARRRILTPQQVPCQTCGAPPLIQCRPLSWSINTNIGRREPHPERVALAKARNRMRRREEGLLARLRRALRR